MRIPTKRILFLTFVVLLVAAAPFAFREYREWREIREEEALEKLEIDSLAIKGATFDEALRLMVEKVHALGHPELKLRIYSNGRECAYFRGRERDDPLDRASTIDLSVVPDGIGKKLNYHGWTTAGSSTVVSGSTGGTVVTLRDVLQEIGYQFSLPCCVRGNDLVAAYTPGTLQRYRKATFRLTKEFFNYHSDPALAELVRANGVQFWLPAVLSG